MSKDFMIKAVIFDFDGVLAESVNVKTDAFCELFKDRPEHVEAIKAYHLLNGGMSRFEKIKYFYKELFHEELTDAIMENLCLRFHELVIAKVVAAPYVTGAKECLEYCREKFKLFIVSGTPHDEIIEVLHKRDMNHYFVDVMGSPEKKHVLIRKIMDQYQWQREEVLFIGDAYNDLAAAKQVGVPFIARTVGDGFDWYEDAFIAARCDDLTPVPNFIEKYNQKKKLDVVQEI